MAATYNLTLRMGDTESVTVTIQDENGSAVDISGRTYAAQVRANAEDTTILATFTCAIVNAAQGILTATLTSTETRALTPGLAVWDLQETNPVGPVVTTLLAGQVTIVQDVTR